MVTQGWPLTPGSNPGLSISTIRVDREHKTMNTIILFVGFPGSGKTTALEAAGEMGIPTLERLEVTAWKFEQYEDERPNERRLLAFERDQREIHRPGIFGHWTAKYLDTRMLSPDTVAIAGIRSPAAVEKLRRYAHELQVVFVEATFNRRYHRMLTSERHSGKVLDTADVHEMDDAADEWGLRDVVEDADYTVKNHAVTEKFFKGEVKKLLAQTVEGV